MKPIKQTLMSGAMILALSLVFTSCDDILGEWDRPASNPVVPTPEPEPTPTVNVTGISLDQSLKVIKLSDAAVTITATITPSNATDKTITWTTSDAAVATVVDGVVTSVGKGLATITAQAGDKTATCEIFVGEVVDLSTKTADYPANDFDILTEALNASYKLTIPDGAKVAFDGVTTSNTVTCSGDATIILTNGSTNTVTGQTYEAGIQVGPTGKTLTIIAETAGTGKLTVQGGTNGAGIGTHFSDADFTGGNIVINGGIIESTGGYYAAGIGTARIYTADKNNSCGKITINGGNVTATGKEGAAGIGTGYGTNGTNKCGDIVINGGIIEATGGHYAAGIGTGVAASGSTQTCGTITIGTGVTSVTATKGSLTTNSIGCGSNSTSDETAQNCGAITIGGIEYWTGTAYANGGGDATTGLPHSPYVYEP